MTPSIECFVAADNGRSPIEAVCVDRRHRMQNTNTSDNDARHDLPALNVSQLDP
jgi:hypothetical protein